MSAEKIAFYHLPTYIGVSIYQRDKYTSKRRITDDDIEEIEFYTFTIDKSYCDPSDFFGHYKTFNYPDTNTVYYLDSFIYNHPKLLTKLFVDAINNNRSIGQMIKSITERKDNDG